MHPTPSNVSRFTGRASVVGRGWRWAFVGLLAISAVWATDPVHGSRERQVKAAFLFQFTKFIEWPPTTEAGAAPELVIGLFGSAPLSDELRAAVAMQSVHGRPVQLRTVQTAADLTGVSLFFVPAGSEKRGAELAAGRSGLVTVGETPEFAARGGVIVFEREADKIRFSINLQAATTCGVKISAQLLKLAVVVRR